MQKVGDDSSDGNDADWGMRQHLHEPLEAWTAIPWDVEAVPVQP